MLRLIVAIVVLGAAAAPARAQWAYPASHTVDAADTYFGKTYKDPYRWLEDLKSPEAQAWFKGNADMTEGLLATIPGRDALVREWMALDKLKAVSYSDIRVEHGRVFYKKTLGGENVGKLFFRESWTGAETLLFDPDSYKAGVTTTIQSTLPSWDGKLVVLGLSSGGAEWSELRVLDVGKRALLPETIYPSYGPYGWRADGRAFLYDAGKVTDIKSMEIELNRKTRLHVIGTPVAADLEVFSNAVNPELGIAPKEFASAYTDEGHPEWLIGSVGTVQNEMRLFYAPASQLGKKKIPWKVLARLSDNLVRSFVIRGKDVYAVTHVGASRYKLVRTSLEHPDWSKAELVVPEAAESIQFVAESKSYLLIVYSNGIDDRIVRYDPATRTAKALELPAKGTVGTYCPDVHSDRCLVLISSWNAPPTRYELDAVSGTLVKSTFNVDVTYPGFEDLVAEEVEVPGHDGTMIPLSIIHRKDLRLDGQNSTILEGYGAYSFSFSPSFSIFHSLALRGVVLAYAHVRGGGEKGEDWYKAGYKSTKPNTWKDFISCAEYLVKKGYTSPAKLAGTGTSAGGVLISRAITERPDLFGAAVCNVCVANATRAEFSPNGPVNTPEFGTVADTAEAQALFEMDGVQHVQKGVKYPALMGVGGWNDPRVVPWEPGKLVAAMQAATASGKPVLMKVNYDDGHFTEEKIVTFKNFASQYAFMLWQTGHKDFQPAEH